MRRALLAALLAAAALPALAVADSPPPPVATISAGPSDPSNSSTASFMFSANENDAQFACALDQEAFSGCTSPLTRAGIPDGRHTFYVVAIKGHDRQQVPSSWTWTLDTTPPPAVAAPHSSVSYRRLELTWTPSADTDHVVIFRFTGEKQVTGVAVYSGPAHRYHESKFDNGRYHRYTIVSYDKAGNASPGGAVFVVPSSALLTAPAPGTVLHAKRAATLRWRRVPGARYYNVQLYRNGHKVLSAWPVAARYRVKQAWTYQSSRFQLKRGTYTWYVWPSMKPLPKVAYGPIVGQSSFVVR
jgi:hypothetical protein